MRLFLRSSAPPAATAKSGIVYRASAFVTQLEACCVSVADAADEMFSLLAADAAEPRAKVRAPALTDVVPWWELTPLSVRAPVPVFASPPAPMRLPEYVTVRSVVSS